MNDIKTNEKFSDEKHNSQSSPDMLWSESGFPWKSNKKEHKMENQMNVLEEEIAKVNNSQNSHR